MRRDYVITKHQDGTASVRMDASQLRQLVSMAHNWSLDVRGDMLEKQLFQSADYYAEYSELCGNIEEEL